MNPLPHALLSKWPLTKVLLLLTLLFRLETATSGPYPRDWEKIKNAYAAMSHFSMEVEYIYFESHSAVLGKEKMRLLLQKKENNYYMKSPDTETLINEKYIVIVDHGSKMLMIDRHERAKTVQIDNKPAFQLDSLVSNLIRETAAKDTGNFSISERKVNAHEKECSIRFESGEYTQVVFVYDPSAFLIRKMALYYRNPVQLEGNGPASPPRMEIVYRSLNTKPGFSKNFFSEKRFAEVKEGGQLSLSPTVSSYNVINHLH